MFVINSLCLGLLSKIARLSINITFDSIVSWRLAWISCALYFGTNKVLRKASFCALESSNYCDIFAITTPQFFNNLKTLFLEIVMAPPVSSIQDFVVDFVKLESFEGSNFWHWQNKLYFFLTTINVVYMLTPRLEETEDESLENARAKQKWDQDDYICKGHICYAMSNALFDQYYSKKSAKEIWDAKYMFEDATNKKFLVSKFHQYCMVDNRKVIEQFHEIIHIYNQSQQHDMKIDESFVVSFIVDKLLPSWKDYKKNLKHRNDDLSLEELAATSNRKRLYSE